MDRTTLIKKILVFGTFFLILLIFFFSIYISKKQQQIKESKEIKEKTQNNTINLNQNSNNFFSKKEIENIRNIMKKQRDSAEDLNLKKEIALSQLYSLNTTTIPNTIQNKVMKIFESEKNKLANSENETLILKNQYFSKKSNIYINPITEEIIISDIKELENDLSKEEIKTLEQINLIKINKDPKTLTADRITILISSKEEHIINPLGEKLNPIEDIETFLESFQNKTLINLLTFKEQNTPPSTNPTQFIKTEDKNETQQSNQISTLSAKILQPTSTPIQINETINIPHSDIDTLLRYISNKVKVPFGVLKGVLMIEGPQYFNLSKEEINQYIQSGTVIPNCKPNVCSATGPMQITIGTDHTGSNNCSQCCWGNSCLDSKGGCPNQWAIYGNSVLKYETSKRLPLPCNLLDNLYAAAEKLKTDSQTNNSKHWTKEEVNRAALRYYGNCTKKYPHLNNHTYCEFVYNVYQKEGD